MRMASCIWRAASAEREDGALGAAGVRKFQSGLDGLELARHLATRRRQEGADDRQPGSAITGRLLSSSATMSADDIDPTRVAAARALATARVLTTAPSLAVAVAVAGRRAGRRRVAVRRRLRRRAVGGQHRSAAAEAAVRSRRVWRRRR